MDRERTVAVTPIVGGAALKGPTVEMLLALGSEATPVEVARSYTSVAGTFVIDSRDAGSAGEIEAMGYRVIVGDTVMTDGGQALARSILGAV
jgi:LPPG:FO 2-phospho-L-lactate transferase